jgi:hypothetical protein
MISMDKTYRTRDGHEVRIYAINIGQSSPIHGAFLDEKEWRIWTWWGTGRSSDIFSNDHDLVEVKPRIKRTVWVNVFPDAMTMYPDKKKADNYAGSARTACVKVEIDCEEGEGL